ncbi:hypothetical protein LCGC14_0619260 [marine sediment metagenome]|uniref:Uncharacterized protein n=1 Tax=marine sediment metagenome TaxID=412755 RepID=A0A0F9RA64_9ZZZZ
MRKLKRTKCGGFEDIEAGGAVFCPLMYSQERECNNCCQDDCAWFKVVKEYGIPLTKNVCLCDTKVIGQLIKG